MRFTSATAQIMPGHMDCGSLLLPLSRGSPAAAERDFFETLLAVEVVQFIRVGFQIVKLLHWTRAGEPKFFKFGRERLLLVRFDDVFPARITRAVHRRVALMRRDVVDELVVCTAHAAAVVHAADGGVQVKGENAMRAALGEDVLPFFRKRLSFCKASV